MQIIIDIPDEDYEIIKNSNRPMYWAEYLIKHGTPLPKGHGLLLIVSEDKLKENQINLDFSCQKWISEVGLSNATVATIEADRSEEE